jgi:polysaccharide pyruvyl transferase WcaK-like protein
MNSNRTVRFHIIHNYTSANKGWASIVLSTVKSLREAIPNAEFTIESYNPAVDKKTYDVYGIKVLPRIVSTKSKAITLFVKALFFRMLSATSLNPTKLAGFKELFLYNSFDVILDLSGDCLAAATSSQNLRFKIQRNFLAIIGNAYLLFLFTLLRKPIVIYGQTIGPIGPLEPLIKPLLNKVSLITVREENSLNYLVKIGIKSGRLFLTADPAFLLQSPSDDEVDNALHEEGINTNSPLVGICVSSETAKYHFPYGEQRFAELFANFIDSLVAKYNVQVVLVPFSIWEGHGGDDRIISKKIIDLVKKREKVKVIKENYSPIILKGIISRCTIFIGSRGHSCILALSSYVPTVAIGHNPKYHGIMKKLNQERYVCNAKELTYDKLFSLVCDLWNSKEKIKENLKSKMREIQGLAKLNAELVMKMLKERAK